MREGVRRCDIGGYRGRSGDIGREDPHEPVMELYALLVVRAGDIGIDIRDVLDEGGGVDALVNLLHARAAGGGVRAHVYHFQGASMPFQVGGAACALVVRPRRRRSP